jgi:hypothetical protein
MIKDKEYINEMRKFIAMEISRLMHQLLVRYGGHGMNKEMAKELIRQIVNGGLPWPKRLKGPNDKMER